MPDLSPTPAVRTLAPDELPAADWYQFLVTAVAPRPIAFVSTVSAAGAVNLSPYSFFNVFSASPPILVFSPTNPSRGTTPKDTLRNVREVAECVINIAHYPLVEQLSLASAAYPHGVSEFDKAGFTPLPSDLVRPPRAAECPAAYECVVEQIMPLGDEGGAGNLVVCRVVRAHFHAALLHDNGIGLDPRKLDAVARLGGNYYARITPASLLEVARPGRRLGIGFDALPPFLRHSNVLTGNDLAKLAALEPDALPTPAQVQAHRQEPRVAAVLQQHPEAAEQHQQLLQLSKQLLADERISEAWKTLMLAEPAA